MSWKEKALFFGSCVSFVMAVYAYFYESRYTEWLPVVTYPFREYTIPLAFIGLALLIMALIVRKFRPERGKKNSASDAKLWVFIVIFLVVGLVMKLVGEAVHELLGHGLSVLLFGGQITDFFISPFWPYEFSRINWNIPSATPIQMAWILGSGILISAIVSFSIQILLWWRQFRWQFSLPLFWLSFWCFVNAVGYLIVGGVFPFGDVGELIHLEVLTPSLSMIIGAALFLAGFFIFSEILAKTLTTFLMEKTRWAILVFWFVIPALTGFTVAGRGIFHFLLIPFSFVPILLSYLSEFQVKKGKQ